MKSYECFHLVAVLEIIALFYFRLSILSFSFRCINRLCELHIAIENFTEAGFTVLKHAELLKVMKKSFKTYGKVVFD